MLCVAPPMVSSTSLRPEAMAAAGTAEIGFAAGFAELSTFYRRFRQRHGVAPGACRAG